MLAIGIRQQSLMDEIEARRPGSSGELVFRSRQIELSESDRGTLAAAALGFAQAVGPGTERLQGLRAEARLLGAVADLLLRESAVVQARAMPTQRIADLEAWIEAHLYEPLTVGRLCAVAGVGERSLQKSFESRRGMSPMRFVVERRLATAQRLLMDAAGAHDVTSVAVRLGFGHIGRFAQLYRTAFGETPSLTRRRAVSDRSGCSGAA